MVDVFSGMMSYSAHSCAEQLNETGKNNPKIINSFLVMIEFLFLVIMAAKVDFFVLHSKFSLQKKSRSMVKTSKIRHVIHWCSVCCKNSSEKFGRYATLHKTWLISIFSVCEKTKVFDSSSGSKTFWSPAFLICLA